MVVPELEGIPETVRRESAFALTLGTALFGVAAGRTVFGPGLHLFAMLVILGVVGWLASDPTRSLGRLAVFCAIGSGLALGPARGLGPRELLLTTIFVGPATLALFLFASTLYGALHPYLSASSHEDGALARLTGSRWLLGVAVLTGLVGALEADLSVSVAAVLVLAIAAVRWALGRDDFTTLRRWLDRARAEDSPRWRVVDAAQVEALETLTLRPLVRAEPLDGVLVQTGVGGPYRGELGGAPVALVPRERTAYERRVGWSLPWRDAGYVVAMLVAFAAPTPAIWLASTALVSFAPHARAATEADRVVLLAASFAAAAIGLASLLATDRRRRVWVAGFAGFAHVAALLFFVPPA
ncbi:MAG: hypothetical protein KC619_32710 [Myxococcales bacterium]|nr:hypothetical protein [Myxococcales bacterium]